MDKSNNFILYCTIKKMLTNSVISSPEYRRNNSVLLWGEVPKLNHKDLLLTTLRKMLPWIPTNISVCTVGGKGKLVVTVRQQHCWLSDTWEVRGGDLHFILCLNRKERYQRISITP